MLKIIIIGRKLDLKVLENKKATSFGVSSVLMCSFISIDVVNGVYLCSAFSTFIEGLKRFTVKEPFTHPLA